MLQTGDQRPVMIATGCDAMRCDAIARARIFLDLGLAWIGVGAGRRSRYFPYLRYLLQVRGSIRHQSRIRLENRSSGSNFPLPLPLPLPLLLLPLYLLTHSPTHSPTHSHTCTNPCYTIYHLRSFHSIPASQSYLRNPTRTVARTSAPILIPSRSKKCGF